MKLGHFLKTAQALLKEENAGRAKELVEEITQAANEALPALVKTAKEEFRRAVSELNDHVNPATSKAKMTPSRTVKRPS